MGGGGPEETHSEECPSEEPEQGSERSKRPRVSFATVETRKFPTEGGSEKLSSPKERELSPLAGEQERGPGSTPFAREPPAGEPGATPHAARRRSSIDGEPLTPGSAELASGGTMLPVLGESDAESMWIGLPQLGATPRPSCSPGRSEASMSPIPEAWDMYKSFRGTSAARHSTLSYSDATCTEAATPAACSEVTLPCAGSDSAEKRRMAATPAGDEATVEFTGFMGRVLEGTEDCEDEENEGEVPEGRKSFAARKLRQHFASQPLASLEMATSPERDDEPQPDVTTAGRLSTASEAQESSLHGSFVSESAPLPSGSSLCYMGPNDTEGSPPAVALSWQDFLQQSGISFPESEPLPRAPAPPEMPRASQLSARWLAYKRALCVSQASSALEERTRAANARLAAQTARWDSAAAPHAVALELQQAVGKGNVAAFAAKLQRLQAESMAAAKLQYAAAKEEWLIEDLKAAREHSERLRAEKEEQERAARALEEKARELAAKLRQKKAQLELKKGMKNMRSMQSALIVPPGKCATANKLAAKPQEKQEAKANEPASANAYLAARLRRVLLQQQRLLRTCVLEDRPSASLSSLELSLRGGARCRVARPVTVAPGSLARLTLMLPPLEATGFSVAALRPGAAELRVLARDLFALAWRRLANALPRSAAVATPTSSVLEITVLCEEVPRLLRSLDEAALRISGQLESLKKAKRRQPEVLRLEARLTEEEEPAVAIAAEIFLERRVEREGCEVRLEAARVRLEMETELESFPRELDLAKARARQLFGGSEAERVARALHCQAAGCREQRPGLAEALATAVEAMRQAA